MPSNWKNSANRSTPVSVYFPDSIWSESSKNGGTADTDESFYFKVWNATKKLNQLDASYGNKLTGAIINENLNNITNVFTPYTASKWSEGINAGPIINSNINSNNMNMNNSSSIDYVDSSISGTGTLTRTGSASTTSCSSSMYATFSTPLGGSTAQIHETSYINDEVEGNANSQDPIALPKITLPNHGKGSAFIAYAQLKGYNKKNILVQPNVKQTNMLVDTRPANENLLTSEFTHFQPIRTYRDGHVFNICSAWDVIDYQRSASGTLCLGNDKYMEYKAHENNNAEDDILPAAASALYASSNCEAAKHMRNQKKKQIGTEFILKFKVRKGCEVACQTEDPNRLAHLNTLKLPEQHPLCLLFAGGAKVNRRHLQNAGAACSDALDALNRAIAAAAKTKTARKSIIKSSNDLMWPTSETLDNSSNDNWSMQAIRKKCQLEQKQQQQQHQQQQQNLNNNNNNNTNNNNNNNNTDTKNNNNNINYNINNNDNNNSCDITDKHTLWGLCAECQNEDKSLPADCMLRAELNEEADEIMSDLKHMQDLYIHRVADTDTTDEEDDENEKLLYRQPQPQQQPQQQSSQAPQTQLQIQPTTNINAEDWRADVCAPTTTSKTAVVVQQMNRFIEDWLRPPLKAAEPATNIWYDKTVRNIWQPTEIVGASATATTTTSTAEAAAAEINWQQPLEFLRQLHVVDNTNVNNEQNTWEHVNLAAIWQKDTPTTVTNNNNTNNNNNNSTTNNSSNNKNNNSIENMIDNNNDDENDDVSMNCNKMEMETETERETKTGIEDEKILAKNYKNLQNINLCKKSKKSQRVLDFLQNYNNLNFIKNNKNAKITTATTTRTADDNNLTDTPKILANRKRRHSASQNYFDQQQQEHQQHHHQQQQQLLLTINNDNEDVVLSTFHKMLQRECCNNNSHHSQNHNEEFNKKILFVNNNNSNNNNHNCDNTMPQQRQTIITCKYWTTAAAAGATTTTAEQNYHMIDDDDDDDDIIDNNVFSCHFDKNNASILHHVATAMVARPLTR